MNNFNASEKFPETYIYNNYNENENEDYKKHEIDIDQMVTDLLQTSKDKNKFYQIMENLERVFLGEENQKNKNNSFKKTFCESNGYRRTNDLEQKFAPSKTHRANYSERQYEDNYNDNNFNFSKNSLKNNIEYNNNQVNNNGKIHKKYTDVHANTKYYYPSEYQNSYEDTELNIEPSQWTDRANRSTLYTNNNYVPNHNKNYENNSNFNSLNLGRNLYANVQNNQNYNLN